MILRSEKRTKGHELLLDADRTRRRAWWLRFFGALAATAGALSQNWLSPAVGGLLLAGGLMLLAVAGEVRRKALDMSKKARRAARREIAEERPVDRLSTYLGGIDTHRAA